MSDFINNLFYFIIAIGVLVTFHEFGHFWVAKKLGVKVLRFSVGFGKPFYVRKHKVGKYQDEVEFALAAIPLGGYVKMLDERIEDVDPAEQHRAFNNQGLGVRSAIVLAGPVFNFILAIALYWLVYFFGISAIQPVINAPSQETVAAKSGFEQEDRIVAVNGETIQTMSAFRLALMDALISDGSASIDVIGRDQREYKRTIEIGDKNILQETGDVIGNLGFDLWQPEIPPHVGDVIAGSAAEKAGMQAGDLIIAIDSQKTASWSEAVKHISTSPGRVLSITVLRSGIEKTMEITPAARINKEGKEEGVIGIYLKRPDEIYNRLYTIEQYGPVEAIGVAIKETWNMSVLTLKVLGRMVIGEAALENISGPLSIAQFAGAAAGIGIMQFLHLLAVISVSLGVLNLLPVPVLDGGHLLYYLAEFVRGKPLSERAQQFGQQIGMVLLFMLMSVAIFNDLQRIFS